MLRRLQQFSLTIGLPLLLFLGLRVERDSPAANTRDVLLIFALLACILLLLTGGICAELGLRWPLLLAIAFLGLLGWSLFSLQ